MRAILLNAGRGRRVGCGNKCLLRTGAGTILDRQLGALKRNGICDVIVVVGHDMAKIQSRYPQLQYVENPLYRVTNTAYSLMMALRSDRRAAFVVNGDTMFSDATIAAMMPYDDAAAIRNTPHCPVSEISVKLENGDIVKIGRGVDRDFESVGIHKFSASTCERLFRALSRSDFNTFFPEVVDDILPFGFRGVFVDDVYEVDTRQDYLDMRRRSEALVVAQLDEENVPAVCAFYAQQPRDVTAYFKPHGFDLPVMMGNLRDGNYYCALQRDQQLVGYGYLRGFDKPGFPALGLLTGHDTSGRAYGFYLGMHLLEHGRALGLDAVILNTCITHTRAIRLYQNLGFRFKQVMNTRCYAIFDYYRADLEIPQHYIDLTKDRSDIFCRWLD